MEKRELHPIEENNSVSADKAFTDIRQIFLDHYQNALLEVGQYMLVNFFGGDIEKVRLMKPVNGDSFNQLKGLIQTDGGSSPSKTWLYNSLKLLVDEHDYRDFQTYGKLSISQKVELLTIKDEKQKKGLIIEVDENDYSVRDLQARKRELKQQMKPAPESDDRSGQFGTKEWADVNINCCTGCSNGCRYCYAKQIALRYKQISSPDDWSQMTINDANVLKRYKKKKDGVIMFPTTHDITPENIYACLIVLDNLLKVGNEVLIVSKPRMECITKICRYLKPYKKQIEFRFTIGAADDEVLRFWEPNAPSFAKRVECLNYAYEKGFKVSVSIEPMLDPENLGTLLENLPMERLESVWLGKMNHVGPIAVNGDEKLSVALAKLKESQCDENILKIYDQWKSDHRIKWKDSVQKVLRKHHRE